MPFINAHYRTHIGAANTGIGGSSAGALAALYAVVSRHGVFGQLVVVPCARHDEAAWAARLPAALRFLYGT